MTPMRRGAAPLRHREFRLLVSGQLASNAGDAVYAVALPWYVLAVHGGAVLLGTVLAAYGIPRTAMILIGGRAADRFGAWNAMMVADAIRAVAVTALAITAALSTADATTLVPIAAILGIGEGLFLPGSFSIVPSLVPDDDLQAANALTSAGTQVSLLAGPALGGLIVATAGATTAFGVDAITFLISSVSLLLIRIDRSGAVSIEAVELSVASGGAAATESSTAPQEMATGLWQLLKTQRLLQLLLLINVVANLGMGGASEVALPALVRGSLHGSATVFGALLAAFGAGALVGTVISAAAPRFRRPVIVASAGFLLESALLAAVAIAHQPALLGACLLGIGAFNGFSNVLTMTAFQRWAPPAMLGRIMSLALVTGFGVFPISVVAAGFVVRELGPSWFFVFAGVTTAAGIVIGLTQRVWREFGMPGSLLLGGSRHEEPALDLVPAGQA